MKNNKKEKFQNAKKRFTSNNHDEKELEKIFKEAISTP